MIERNIITLCEQFLTRFNVGVVKEDIVKLYRLGRHDYLKSTPSRGVTTAPADPAMQGGPRTQGAQAGCPKIFSSL